MSDRAETLVRLTPRRADASADDYTHFIDGHIEEAYRLATFILGDRNDAEDAVHEAAISAWRHWSERRDAGHSEAWFRRIVVNAARDQLRARRRVRTVDVGLDIDAGRHPLAQAPDASVAARDEVARALERLDTDARALLSLRFGLDLTVPAIAAAMGIREGTVKSRLHRALREVRMVLGEQAR